jgi:hypothetical protein
VVVIVRYIRPAKDAEGGFLLDLFGTVRTIAGLGLPAGDMLLPVFVQVWDFAGLPVQIVLNGGMQGIRSQVGAVQLILGQAPQGFGHVFVGDFHGLV